MKTHFTLSLLCSLALSSCEQSPCRNSIYITGKYVNHRKKQDINYIILKPDNSYLYYYQQKGKTPKTFRGKWKKVSTPQTCKINLQPWKDLAGYKHLDKVDSNKCEHYDDKIVLFEDINGTEYTKEIPDPFHELTPLESVDEWSF
jgi:hypothetical protein